LWEKICRLRLHKSFTGKFGEFGQKSFTPPKFACSYTYEKAAPPPLPPFERIEG